MACFASVRRHRCRTQAARTKISQNLCISTCTYVISKIRPLGQMLIPCETFKSRMHLHHYRPRRRNGTWANLYHLHNLGLRNLKINFYANSAMQGTEGICPSYFELQPLDFLFVLAVLGMLVQR